ncbi:MAG: HEAT repeat domain-containing protein, partial [Planctomycetaceae bacterium]|nr:HEAT repeat domain-containing protein [Planctomycetaceae bacterium]
GPARPDAVKAEDLPPADLAQILRDIGSRDPEIRAGGVEAARRFPDKSVASRHVVKILEDRDPDLRAIAANVLGSLGQGSSVEALRKALEKPGEKDQVRAMAVRALRDIGGRDAVAALAWLVRESQEPADRAAALGMLTDMKETGEVRGVLPKALDDIAPEVRQAACISIRTLEIRDFEKELVGLLEDFSDNVIIDAMRSLGATKARSAVGPILKLLLKPDPESEDPEQIQHAANAALEAITGEKQGYADTIPEEMRLAAIDSWRTWWQKNRDKWK